MQKYIIKILEKAIKYKLGVNKKFKFVMQTIDHFGLF